MKTIWKFPIPTTDIQEISIPQGAEILTVQMQGDMPCLWAIIDTDASLEPRTILTLGTGHKGLELSNGGQPRYIGTYQIFGGSLIFHVFDGGVAA